MLKSGYAEVDITPQDPIETIGFNRGDNISRGILKPLLAQVAVWNDDDTYCLVTIDSLGFKQVLTDNLRKRVRNVLNTTFEKVMIWFSHCHSAPNAEQYRNIMIWYAEKSKQQRMQRRNSKKSLQAGEMQVLILVSIEEKETIIWIKELSALQCTKT